MSSADPHGKVALLLCEALLHVLVEEGVLKKEKTVEAIEGVGELVDEMARDEVKRVANPTAVELVRAIAISFAAKD